MKPFFTSELGGRVSLLVVLCSLGHLSCKTQNARLKDAENDTIKASLPEWLVEKVVPSKDIAKYIAPGDGSNGAPQVMNGLWWTDAKTIQFVLSFRNSVWFPAQRRAIILFTGPGNYSNSKKFIESKGNVKIPMLSAASYGDLEGYDIDFAPDYKSAKLYKAETDSGGNRRLDDSDGYTMTLEGDDLWVRHSVGRPDYSLRRIVNADGTPTANFAHFLDVFGPDAVVQLPTKLLTEAAPKEVKVAADGTPNYLGVATAQDATDPDDDREKVQITTIAVDTPDKVNFSLIQNTRSKPLKSGRDGRITGFLLGVDEPLLAVSSSTKQDETVNFSMTFQTPLPIQAMTPMAVDLPKDTGVVVDLKKPLKRKSGLFRLDVASPEPVSLIVLDPHEKANNAATGAPAVIIDMTTSGSLGPFVRVATTSGAPAKVTLNLTQIPLQKTAKGALVVDGPAVSGTLANVYGQDMYTVALTTEQEAALDSHKLQIDVVLQEDNNNPPCCIQVFNAKTGTAADPDFSYSHSPSRAVESSFLDSKHHGIGVVYGGDFNVANTGLNYRIQLRTHQ